MACYFPWIPKGAGAVRPLCCGQCHGCRLERSRQWAVRCMHEASLYDSNSFVTLTYRDDVFSLEYSHFQSFIRRLRARVSRARLRFYMCGEYGELNSRGHFHALIFNFAFPDLCYLRKSSDGSRLYRSPMLESLWPHGFSSVGSVTFESAAYVARYAMKKVSGSASTMEMIDPNTGELFSRTAPFSRMSLKPGIGAPWLDRFFSDVYPSGNIVMNGHECRAPRYYDRIARKRNAGAMMLVNSRRRIEQDKYFSETLPGRLEARSAVKAAQLSKLKRSLT